eukprot:CAMPEP_0172498508 /NCGR_PEP_ID=MMETSP1066-20121228/113480_1 /TAXON_ID=671091 /ORGANISM="Coscinodiscus wailesii, Strain CCMP2513" /LENGTH=262 /DNA_ID=CAMNT_0013271801 /DNA_START=47 /DNA_END=835 /DNA_ORIENTATION=-
MSSIDDELEAIERAARGERPTSSPMTRAPSSTSIKKSGKPRKGSMMALPPGFSMKKLQAQQGAQSSYGQQAAPTQDPQQDEDDSGLLVDFPGSDDDFVDDDEEGVEATAVGATTQITLTQSMSTPPSNNNPAPAPVQPKPDETKDEVMENQNAENDLPKTTNESRPGGDHHIAELLRKQMEQRTAREQTDYNSDDDNFNISDVTYGGREQPMPTGMGGGPAPDRPLVGGFAAAAYEAARAHYLQNQGRGRTQRAKGYTPPSI